MTSLEICAILERHGFFAIRDQGNHRIMQQRTFQTTITIPIPLNAPLRRATLQCIIRQSALPEDVFQS
ncbi:MAG TPA: type II toxin-antitoxin system HicA family toxin [Bryobacteraceae bacterium]|nr:type II toxin-antitoxin system HicA family toxin [Bryobacteraceae bacterium]